MPDTPLSPAEDQARRIKRAEQLYTGPAGAEAVFDPAEHTVAEVEDYLAAHPDDAGRVLKAEAKGKNRATLTG